VRNDRHDKSNTHCPICDGQQGAQNPKYFKRATPQTRQRFVKEHRLCFSCLRGGHMARSCREDSECQVNGCLLHEDLNSSRRSPQAVPDPAREARRTLPPTEKDFKFNVKFHKVPIKVLSGERFPTKREFLSLIMLTFDPLGILCCFMITAKLLLREIHSSLTKIMFEYVS